MIRAHWYTLINGLDSVIAALGRVKKEWNIR